MKKEDYLGRPGGEQLDCAVRAITVLVERPYPEVHATFRLCGRNAGSRTSRLVIAKVAKRYALRHVVCRRTVRKFLDDVQHIPRLAAVIRGHAFGVVKGVIADYEYVNPNAIVKFYYVK